MSNIVLLFLRDYGIDFSDSHHHHSLEAGWIALKYCPFCHSNNYHLGINHKFKSVNCWRCGTHSLKDLLFSLPQCKGKSVQQILSRYFSSFHTTEFKKKTPTPTNKACLWPIDLKEQLPKKHRQYLQERNFDPDHIIQKWNIKATGVVGPYNFRIIIPITHKGIMVSYTGRDITGKSSLRYKTCKKEDETFPHKHCLYGLDKVRKNSVVVVEGVTDVWRLGIGAVATLGISWTMAQASLLLGKSSVFVLFDADAHQQANKLANILAPNINHVEVIQLKLSKGKDPADMTEAEARYLMKDLGIGG